MQDKPEPIEPIIVTSVSDDRGDETKYRGVTVSSLIADGKSLEEVIWLLWTGKLPDATQKEIARQIIIMTADHGPAVAGAYSTILAASAGLELSQSVSAGVQIIGPRFGGASAAAAKQFQIAVTNEEPIEQFVNRLKSEGVNYIPGIGHRVFSKSKPDKRVGSLVKLAKEKLSTTSYLDFALSLEDELLRKNEKLILNIDGTIGAVLLDLGFPLEGIDGFFVLGRSIGLIAHYIDQKQRGTGLIRLPEELILYK